MFETTLQKISENMAEAIREWNRAKLERESWKPVVGQVPPVGILGNAKKANAMLSKALEEYEAFQQSVHPTEGGGWVCSKCKTINSQEWSDCCFCDTPRIGG